MTQLSNTTAPDPEGRQSLFGERPQETVAVKTGMFGSQDGDTSGFGGLTKVINIATASQRPYGGWFDDAVDFLSEVLTEQNIEPSHAIESVTVDREELTLFINREYLVQVCQILRDDHDLRFELSLGVSGVHYPGDEGRELHAVYHLVSVTHNRRVRLDVACPDSDPTIPSTVDIYPANDWHERETWDFFGIIFTGRDELTRIEMPDDWPGHPQRKDYPLGGIPVEYHGATIPPADQRRKYS